jgi:3alpha(or 20beta)-hydroxysteroid dehydrogenase
MTRLDGKIVIVSGGARGLGAAHATAMVREGAKVVIADVLDDAGEKLAAELGSAAIFRHLDVTSEDDWHAVVEATAEAFGPVNVLVNNAGIANAGGIDRYTLEQWNSVIAVNLTGTFLGAKAVAGTMKSEKRGSIINISSIEGLRGGAALHGYVASKFGVRGLTKSLAVELAKYGIRVNSVHPGYVITPMTESLDPSHMIIPLGRGAQPEEVSAMVVYLASDESGYSTGAEFVVDGGMTAGVPEK